MFRYRFARTHIAIRRRFGYTMPTMDQKADRIQAITLNSASFFANFAITMMSMALVYHLRSVFHLAPSEIGISTQVNTASYLIGCLFLNRLVSRLKPRHCVTLAMSLMAFSMVVFVSAKNLIIAYAALAFYGLSMSMLWPAVETWFSRGKEGKQLNKATNGFNFSWSFGTGLATGFSGLLIERSTYLPFYVGIIMIIVICLYVSIVALLVPGIRSLPSEKVSNKEEEGKRDQSTPLRFYCWTGVVLVYTGMSVIQNIFPLYASDHLGIRPSVTGMLLLIRGILTCLTFLSLSHTMFWQFDKRTILGIQVAFGLLCLCGAFFHSIPFFCVFFFLFGIIFAFGYSLSMFHGVAGCINRTRRMAIHEILLTVGQVIGAVAGGFLYEHVSFSSILLCYGIIALVVVMVELFLRLR